MPYSTTQDIIAALSEETLKQLTDDENAAEVKADRVAKAIADADAEIDLYCAAYGVPFTTPLPAIIPKLSVDIAAYNLYSRRAEEIPPTRQERYDNAIRTLTGIAGGTVKLELPSGTQAPGRAGCNKTYDDRIITLTTLTNY